MQNTSLGNTSNTNKSKYFCKLENTIIHICHTINQATESCVNNSKDIVSAQ